MRIHLSDTFSLAFDTLVANKFRAALTMLGVTIGVASVILLVSIGDGVKHFVTDQFEALGTNVIIITPGKAETTGGTPMIADTTEGLTLEDATAIRDRSPNLTAVAPVCFGTANIKFSNRNRSTMVIGTTAEFETVRHMHVEVGSFLPPAQDVSEKQVAILGRKVKDALFPGENPLGKRILVDDRRFRVIGVMQKKGQSLGLDLDDLIFVPVSAAQEIFNRDRLQEILAHSPTKGGLDRGAIEAKAVLMNRHDNKEDFTVHDQGDMLAVLTTIMGVLTYALAGIAGISLLVGGIGIMNIMLVSVTERTREIGIRKAVGARRGDILAQFLIESVILSSAGGIAGILLGVGAGQGAHAIFPDMPIAFSPWAVVIAFGFSFFVGVFFGVYPARRASLLDPIAALRVE
ncbi:MAG: ABC transporter permease [Planctomycetes bacterium]|nr:ABC transporter permease [Planctomycetota bacterium]